MQTATLVLGLFGFAIAPPALAWTVFCLLVAALAQVFRLR